MDERTCFTLQEFVRDITTDLFESEVAWDMKVRFLSLRADLVTVEFPVWIYGHRKDVIRERVLREAAKNGLVVNEASLMSMAYPEGPMCKKPDMILTGTFRDICGTR